MKREGKIHLISVETFYRVYFVSVYLDFTKVFYWLLIPCTSYDMYFQVFSNRIKK